jgi:hypothetical protein
MSKAVLDRLTPREHKQERGDQIPPVLYIPEKCDIWEAVESNMLSSSYALPSKVKLRVYVVLCCCLLYHWHLVHLTFLKVAHENLLELNFLFLVVEPRHLSDETITSLRLSWISWLGGVQRCWYCLREFNNVIGGLDSLELVLYNTWNTQMSMIFSVLNVCNPVIS